jgi:hypothetical protein
MNTTDSLRTTNTTFEGKGPEITFIPGKLYRYIYRPDWPVEALVVALGENKFGYDPLVVFRSPEDDITITSKINLIDVPNLNLKTERVKLNQVVMFVGWDKIQSKRTCCRYKLYFLVNSHVYFLPQWLFATEINWIFEGPL